MTRPGLDELPYKAVFKDDDDRTARLRPHPAIANSLIFGADLDLADVGDVSATDADAVLVALNAADIEGLGRGDAQVVTCGHLVDGELAPEIRLRVPSTCGGGPPLETLTVRRARRLRMIHDHAGHSADARLRPVKHRTAAHENQARREQKDEPMVSWR